MNPLAEALSAAIENEEAMCADDRREGYADGLANHYQPKRGATYDTAWYQGYTDGSRLDPPRRAPSIWARIRSAIARTFA